MLKSWKIALSKDHTVIISVQKTSAIEEARGADGARAAEDDLAAAGLLSKNRPMESDFTMLFITCEESRVM